MSLQITGIKIHATTFYMSDSYSPPSITPIDMYRTSICAKFNFEKFLARKFKFFGAKFKFFGAKFKFKIFCAKF